MFQSEISDSDIPDFVWYFKNPAFNFKLQFFLWHFLFTPNYNILKIRSDFSCQFRINESSIISSNLALLTGFVTYSLHPDAIARFSSSVVT